MSAAIPTTTAAFQTAAGQTIAQPTNDAKQRSGERSDHKGHDHISKCPHEYVEQGVCQECGLTMTVGHLEYEQEFTSSHQRSTQTTNVGIEKELEIIDLPANVKESIFKKWMDSGNQKARRDRSRKEIILAFAIMAMAELEIAFNYQELATKIGITDTRAAIGQANRMVAGISPEPLIRNPAAAKTISIMVTSPKMYMDKIRPWLSQHGYADGEADLVKLIDTAIKLNPRLIEEQPEWMLYAFLSYWLTEYKKVKKVTKLHSAFGITTTALKQSLDKVRATFQHAS